MLEVEERVNHLDELMAQLIQTVDRTSREMRLSRERSEWEMQDFKEEMRRTQERADARSRREMQEFKEEMRLAHERAEERSKREMQEFKEEMRLAHERVEERSKREMQEFKEEMRQSKRDLDKKWGELSNKLGTMAEDLVAPSVPNILKQVMGCPKIKSSAVRVRKSEPRNQEFDVVAVCDEWVLINETKSRLKTKHFDDFYELMQEIHEFFPEFAGKKFIGAIASLYVDESLVRQGEKLGLIVLGFGEELMDVLNSPSFVPKQF